MRVGRATLSDVRSDCLPPHPSVSESARATLRDLRCEGSKVSVRVGEGYATLCALRYLGAGNNPKVQVLPFAAVAVLGFSFSLLLFTRLPRYGEVPRDYKVPEYITLEFVFSLMIIFV